MKTDLILSSVVASVAMLIATETWASRGNPGTASSTTQPTANLGILGPEYRPAMSNEQLNQIFNMAALNSFGGRGGRSPETQVIPQGAAALALSPNHLSFLISTAHGRSFQEGIQRELMATEGPAQSWPPAPRAITEISSTHYQTFNITHSLRITGINLGPRVNHNARYSVKTSFYTMVSLRNNPNSTDQTQPPSLPATRPPLSQPIFRLDPRTMKNYISLGSGFPRIGYCVYEISYQEERSHGLSVDTGFNNLSADEGKVRSVSFTFMSNFVEMRPDVSISDYLGRFCQGIFETEIKAFAEMNFAQLYLEFRAHRLSQCQPTQGPLNPAGDPQCQAWAERSLHPAIRRRTVARCEQQADLSFRCVAKAREGGLCPAWRSREPDSLGQFRISELRQHPSDIRLSLGYQEFPCDQGLRCEQDSFSFSGLLGRPNFTCRH